jgi:hypothetical protein
MPHTPGPAPQESSIGQIFRILSIPCSAPPSLWVQTAIPELLRGFYSILQPDLKEQYHRTFGQSLVCSLKQEIAEAREAEGKSATKATRFLFTAAEWADMTFWYAFLASIAVEGIADWTSQVYKIEGCIPDPNRNSNTGRDPIGAVFDRGNWDNNAFVWRTDNPDDPEIDPQLVLEPGQRGVLAVHTSGEDLAGISVPLSLRIQNTTTGTIYEEFTPSVVHDGKFEPSQIFRRVKNTSSFEQKWQIRGTCFDELPDGECFPSQGGMCTVHKWNAGH